MAIHLWHTSSLARELASNTVSESDGMKYMLVALLLYTYTTYWGLWFGSYRDWVFFLELILIISIGLTGVYECYKANGRENGTDFVLRFCSLAVPIGVKVAVLKLVAGQLLYFSSDSVLASGAFRDPDLAYRFIFFTLSIAAPFIFYWRIVHHMSAIAALQGTTKLASRSLKGGMGKDSIGREDAA